MNKREAKYLGAFLHDIGKFLFRAFELDKTHEELSEDFFEDNLKLTHIFKRYPNLVEITKYSIKRQFEDVKLADFEAAQERETDAKSSLKTRRPLVSIFSRVDIGKFNNISFKVKYNLFTYFFIPSPINRETINQLYVVGKPIQDWLIDEKSSLSLMSEHCKCYNEFKEELKILRHIEKFRPFFATLYKLFEKYTSRVSSASYASVPDISLFDHSRIVAALSICINEGQENNECLLIKGDISGIQNFIYYQIEEAERASKQLRGRSFFVKILADAVANYLIRVFDVFDANIIFCNGGNFELLIPNTSENFSKLLEAEKNINKILLKKFGGVLQLVLSYVHTSAERLINNYFDVKNELEYELQKQKKKKSLCIIDELMGRTYEVTDIDKYEKFYISLGKSIVHSNYLVEINFKPYPQGNYLGTLDVELVDFSEFGSAYFFSYDSKQLIKDLELLSQYEHDYIIIHNIKDTNLKEIYDFVNNSISIADIGYSYKLIGSFIPTKGKEPLTFEDLASDFNENKKNEQSNGNDNSKNRTYPLLGVARIDVDNLGAIFSFGLQKEKRTDSKEKESKLYTISRVATLSRELDLFFSGHINNIAQKHNIYLVYSGGDDLFAVGNWLRLIDFVQEVKKDFRQFACLNPNFTLSCGTVFVKPYYPTAKFAKEAEEQEKLAKNQGKNRISIFYREVTWDEFSRLMNIASNFYELVKGDGEKSSIPRSFIHSLLSITQQCINEKGKLDLNKVNLFLPKLHYIFARRGILAKELQNSSDRQTDEETKRNIEQGKVEKIVSKVDSFKRVLARYFVESNDLERTKWFKNFQIIAYYVLLRTRKK